MSLVLIILFFLKMRLVNLKTNFDDYSCRTGVDMSLKRIRGATIVGDLVFTSGMSGGDWGCGNPD